MRKPPPSDTELYGIAEEIHSAFEAAFATEDEEADRHGISPERDKHYDHAIAILRNVAEGREWDAGVDL